MYNPSFRTNRNSVPILSKKDIEAIGRNFIMDFCPDALVHPQAIDIEGFIECYLKMKLDYQYLSNDGRYLGMTVFNDTDKVIIYDPEKNQADYFHADARTVIIDNTLLSESQEHRYRYTLGHEGGHDIFHSAYYYFDPNQISMFDSIPGDRMPMVQCRLSSYSEAPSTRSRKIATDNDWMEWQANYFSSVLLMPKDALVKLSQEQQPYKDKKVNEALLIFNASETFNVSAEAAAYRCKELGLVSPDMTHRVAEVILDFDSIL